jgi:hypothetical protein
MTFSYGPWHARHCSFDIFSGGLDSCAANSALPKTNSTASTPENGAKPFPINLLDKGSPGAGLDLRPRVGFAHKFILCCSLRISNRQAADNSDTELSGLPEPVSAAGGLRGLAERQHLEAGLGIHIIFDRQ